MDFQIENGELKKAWGYDEHVTVPEGVTRLCEGVFASFAYLEEIELPSTLKIIEDHAFNNCMELRKLDIPNSVEVIGEYAFQYCKKAESVRLPASLTRIGSCTFRYCEALKSMSLPDSVSLVEYDAFFGCAALESFSAHNPECAFGRRVFYGCSSLKHLDAPASALLRLDEEQLAEVCAGFCRTPRDFSQMAESAYRDALSKPSSVFMSLICRRDDDRALSSILQEGLLEPLYADAFIKTAQQSGANKCISALLEYKNRCGTGGIDAAMRELEL